MDRSLITFSVIVNDGQVQGFKLIGSGETEAESFCHSFVRAAIEEKARIVVKGDKIIFTHDGIGLKPGDKFGSLWTFSDPDVFETEISPEQATALDDLLNGRGSYQGKEIQVKYIYAFGKGFELLSV